MKRGTAAKVILGKDTLMDVPAGIVHGTDVILGGKAGLVNDFGGLVLSNNLMLGKKISRSTIITVTVRGQSPLVLPDAIGGSLQAVKAFGGTEQRNLPDDYIERQFIYMMDGSYLLTDIIPTYDGRIEMDFQTTSIQSGATSYLGGRSDSYPAGLRLGTGSNSRFVVTAFSDSAYTATTEVENNTRYKFTFNNKVATLESGGSTLFTNTFTGENANGAALVINGLNSAGTITPNLEGIYLYSFKAWNAQGELVADYVPAVQKGTVPVVGFYDTVSKTFKTATAGTFAAGGEAVPTPDAPMDIVSNNGVLKYSRNKINVIADNVVVGKYISAQGVLSDSEYNFTYMPYVPVKPNTTYTLSFSSPVYFSSVSEYSSAEDAGFVIRQTKYSTSLDAPFDLTEFTFTTGATTNYVRFGLNMYRFQSLTIDDVLALNYMLAESATAVPYAPYVSANGGVYTDGLQETINVHTKNLLDPSFMDNSTYGTVNVNGTTFDRAKILPTENGKTYTLSTTYMTTGESYYYVFKVLPDGTYAVQSYFVVVTTATPTTSYKTTTFTASDNATYLVQAANVPTLTRLTLTEYQMELGSTATDYVPYYDGGTATTEMLLKVGDYQDVQSILDGVVTRNVGVKVLDGTEAWLDGTSPNVFLVSVSNKKSGKFTSFCNYYTYSSASQSVLTHGTFGMPGSGSNMFFKDERFSTASDFATWLASQYNAGTPVIVVYPLETPTTESVTGQTLQVQDGDNIVEITQASLSGLELEASYQSLVRLTIQEVEDANLNNNVEVTIS